MSNFFTPGAWWDNAAIRPLGVSQPFDADPATLGKLYEYNANLADWHDEVNQLVGEYFNNSRSYSYGDMADLESQAMLELQDSWPIPPFSVHKVQSGGTWWEIVIMDCERWQKNDHMEIAAMLAKNYARNEG